MILYKNQNYLIKVISYCINQKMKVSTVFKSQINLSKSLMQIKYLNWFISFKEGHII